VLGGACNGEPRRLTVSAWRPRSIPWQSMMQTTAVTWSGRARGRRSHLGLVVVLAVAIYAGLIGIDFGYHWDEWVTAQVIRDAVTRGELLPRWYCYPSISFDLGLLSAAWEIASKSVLCSLRGSAEETAALTTLLGSGGFLLRTRAVFFLVSMLSVVWVYWLAWDWSRSRAEAALAAGLLAFSWELGYHARWIAPDAVMMQFGALSLLCARLALSRGSVRWSWAAAAAAGLACGTKYPGGAFVLPICWCAGFVARDRRRGPLSVLGGVAGALAVFALAYLASTPGTLLEYRRFFSDVRREYTHYHQLGHGGGHTIEPGLPHLRASIEYLSFAALSRFPSVAVIFTALAAVGVVEVVREQKLRALVFLSFPVFYVGYMSLQRVIVVRNLLAVVPFLALFAARGGAVAVRAARRVRGGRLAVATTLAALCMGNAAWLVWAARTVARDADPLAMLSAYVHDNPGRRFMVTPRVEQALRARLGALPPNVVPRGEGRCEEALFYASEVKDSDQVVAFHHDSALRWFGSYEVNYNYYPTWQGRDRIVAMALPAALRLLPPPRAGVARMRLMR
jgi:4-amino-4-deoxy-L-arabinose transferase-like glycosyltransferase